jgi:hypothetical protein
MVSDVSEVHVRLKCLRLCRSDSWPLIMRGHIGEPVIDMHLRSIMRDELGTPLELRLHLFLLLETK